MEKQDLARLLKSPVIVMFPILDLEYFDGDTRALDKMEYLMIIKDNFC